MSVAKPAPISVATAFSKVPWVNITPGRLGLLVAVALLPALFAQGRFDLFHRVAAAALGIVAFLIADHDWRASRAARRAPMLATAAATYYVYFGLALIWEQPLRTVRGTVKAEAETILIAQLAVLLGLTCFTAGYHLLRRWGDRAAPAVARTLPGQTDVRGLLPWAAFWTLVAVLVQLINALSPGTIPDALKVLVDKLFAVPLVIGSLAWIDHVRGTAATRAFLLAATIGLFLVGLLGGMLGAALLPLATLVGVRTLLRNRVPWLAVFSGLALFLVLQPAKMTYREETFADEHGRRRDIGVQERFSLWWDSLVTTWTGHAGSEPKPAESLSRVAELMPVAQVIEWVPDRVPYAAAAHWLEAPSMWIPRLFWTEKPVLDMWRDYGVTFGRQTELGARTTAVGIPQVAEGYWSFGWIGVAISTFVSGAILGLIAGALALVGWAQFALAMTFLLSLWAYTPTPSLIAGLPQQVFGPWLGAWLLALGRMITITSTARAQASTGERPRSAP